MSPILALGSRASALPERIDEGKALSLADVAHGMERAGRHRESDRGVVDGAEDPVHPIRRGSVEEEEVTAVPVLEGSVELDDQPVCLEALLGLIVGVVVVEPDALS